MAIVATQVAKPYSTGDRFRTITSFALDSSYPTGGYAVTKLQLGFAATADPEFMVELDSANGWSATFDYVNLKIVLWSAANTQVTNATDVSSVTALRALCTGKFRA
jgi:hypothetical protein